jgi:hypothetical protein
MVPEATWLFEVMMTAANAVPPPSATKSAIMDATFANVRWETQPLVHRDLVYE